MPMQEWLLPLAMMRVRVIVTGPVFFSCLCVLQFLFTSLITGEVTEDPTDQQQDAGSKREPLINK